MVKVEVERRLQGDEVWCEVEDGSKGQTFVPWVYLFKRLDGLDVWFGPKVWIRPWVFVYVLDLVWCYFYFGNL